MRLLAETLANGRALVPYLTAFDPSAESFVDAALGAVDGGAAALEIGLPFSDPVADGPIIQRAHARALDAGGSVAGSLGLVKALRGRTSVPLVLFTYFNPVLAFGPLEFLEAARSAGADGILCLDCPPEEEPGWFDAVTGSGLDPIVLLGPNTGAGRAPLILERGGGFVYVVAREGVTGSGLGREARLEERVALARRHSDLPVAVGFGVKEPADVRRLWALCEGAVVGSAFIHYLESVGNGDRRAAAAAYVRHLTGGDESSAREQENAC
jgi:tryptophan synthase alpha chain